MVALNMANSEALNKLASDSENAGSISFSSNFKEWGENTDIVSKGNSDGKRFKNCCKCFKKKKYWEPVPQENVFKSKEVAETKNPTGYRILEYKFWDALFVFSCLASIFLITFCEGFMIQSRFLWGVIHAVNAMYACLLLLQWVTVVLKSKYSQSGFIKFDVIFSLLSLLPTDLIVLLVQSLSQDETNPEAQANDKESHITFTFSRIHYILRINNILNYLSGWENQLILGDFYSFLLRILLYSTFMLHSFACVWHRIACNSIRPKHFLMEANKAREDLCVPDSWIMKLAERSEASNFTHFTPFLKSGPGDASSILWDHYTVSIYWTVSTAFRLGYGDIEISMVNNYELVWTAVVQIVSWIFVLAMVSGTLTSLLIESDTERESYLTRRFAINHYLSFSPVGKSIIHEVKKFYDYLWSKRKGVSELQLVEFMPAALKSEIFFDIHKFVLEQMPLFQDLEVSFLMTLSVRMSHSFHLTGETLFRRNDRGNHMYYVLKGHLEIMSADESHPIACIKSGSAIGDIFLVHPYSHSCTVRCGSECDVLALTRQSVTEVLKDYPHYSDILQNRAQERFEQCVLLLSLAKKYNEAPKLFQRLPYEMPMPDVMSAERELEDEMKLKNSEDTLNNELTALDADGLSMTSTLVGKLSTMLQSALAKKEKKMDKRRRSAQEEAFTAFAADVNRTLLLAKDLGLGRAPLTITPPVTIVTRDSKDNVIGDNESLMMKLKHIPILNGEERSEIFLCWKFFVSLCTCIVLFYYPYQFAFRSTDRRSNAKYDGAMHQTDIIFALDFFFDMLQIVVTPQRTLETVNEIMSYRIRSITFYLRLIAFMPFEYVIAPAIGIDYGDSPYYYMLKSNRFLEFIVLRQFFQDLEGVTKIPIMAVFLTKFFLLIFYVIHFFAVCYEYLLRDFIPEFIPNGTLAHLNETGDDHEEYGFVLYWSTQVVSTAGFGDIFYYYNIEVYLLCFAFISGTVVSTYLGAKLAAILANAQRRRISFKQTYYGVTAFLQHRKFPEDLSHRIKAYYRMQWKAHEGVLIPKERSAIWDAPEAIISEVALSQALKYMNRVPLVKHTSEDVLRNMCSSLKQYFVPPDECVLFEGDKRRELYIIVKGFCNVYRGSEYIGHLSEGNYFGLSGLIMGVNLKYRITTETHCLFFCLQFDDFVEIAKKHKFLRKDYRLLRGETPFENLENLVTGPSNKWDNLTNNEDAVVEELEKASVTALPEVLLKRPKLKLSFILRFLLLRITFLPSGKFVTCWVILRVIAASAVAFFVLAQVTFNFDPEVAFLTILSLDMIAWLDMYLMLHVAYHNELNQLVTDPLKTARNYLTGPFVLDLLTSFPLDHIVILCMEIDVFSSHGEHQYKDQYEIISLLRLNRFFQFYKLIQLGVTLNQMIVKSLTFVTLLEVMPWMLISIHILACISVHLVCSVSANGDDFTCSKSAWLTHGSMFDNSNGPDLNNPWKLYVISFYWTIATALRVGFGDIDLINMQNRLLAVFVILAGILVTTYLSSKLTACMVGEDSRRIEIRNKIDIMNSFLEKYKASRSVKRRVKEIYYNEWDKTKGISGDNLFVALHPSLKADVMCHLYEESIRRSPPLKTLDEPGIRMLASILREVFLVEGEYIFKYGNITDDVFLVASGIVSAYNIKGEVMSYMGAGSLIGEISALYGVTRLYTAVAATDVDILVFNSEDFLDFLELYPDLKDHLEQLCENMGQAQEGFLGSPVDVESPSDNALDPYTRLENTISTSSPKHRVRKNARIPTKPTEGTKYPPTVKVTSGAQINYASRNPMCILDPLRVPLKHGQLNEEERELMLQDSGSDKKWWSVFITFGRVPKTEMGTLLHIFQDKKRCNLINFTVHPASPVTRGSGWCVFNLLITAISCALTAYEISFTSNNAGESWPIACLRYLAELFFVTRIIGNFHLGYVDDSGVLVTDVKKISKRYCTRFDGFILDMVTTAPFYAICYIMGGPNQYLYAANIRGIQLLRVILFARYLGETNNDLRMKASEVKILKITILLCFIFHFCACAWYLVACYGMRCEQDSWMSVLLKKLEEDGSIDRPEDISISSRYFISLAYVTTTITATGLNNVTPRTMLELLVTVGFIFGTVFVIGYLLGEMTQCLASQISRKIHYEHELSVVEEHLAGLGLNKSKRDIVADYYKLVWKRFRGMPYFSLLRELPYPLRADICFEIYESNLKNARVLGTVDDQVLKQLTARIRHEFYLPGGFIVRGGNVCDAMYFVKRGEVLIIDENMGIELCVETLYENDCFGEIKILMPREAYRFSYVARVESEVGVLKRDDLDEVFKNFPGLRNELLDKIRSAKFHRHSDKDHGDTKPGSGADRRGITTRKSRHSKKYGNLVQRMQSKEMKAADIAKIETINNPQQLVNTGNNLGFSVVSTLKQPKIQVGPDQQQKKNPGRPMTSYRVDPLNQAVQKRFSLPEVQKPKVVRDARSVQPNWATPQTGVPQGLSNNLQSTYSVNNAENGLGSTQSPILFEYVPRHPAPKKKPQKGKNTKLQRKPPKK